ncbi:hypothetical protein [Ruminiclostridium cellobioparum]|uniref:hypothetical protein n=1 Tax=Ruminiclostridium cellobioparum TaxID=29355 RepID=UPI0009FC4B95|nr:hypothetical protein [Ruminiclostridium cellobioparum]
MKKTLSTILSLICIFAILFSINIPIYAAGDPTGVLGVIGDGASPKEHQALTMSVNSVASTSPLQAFCIGWQFEFSNSNGSISIDIDLREVKTNGGSRTYTFPITTGWTKESTGIKGGNSLRDMVSDKATFDRIIKDGCTVTANAIIRKYSYFNGKFTPLGTYAYTKDEIAEYDNNGKIIGGNFTEFSSAFISNTRNDYFDLTLTLKPEPVPIPDPKVNLTLPINNSTVLQGTVVTFKGFGTGIHHISGFVDGKFMEEQGNPSEDYNDQMKFETIVKLDEIRDYTFQIKGRNTANLTDAGSKLAESAIHTVHVIKPPANSGTIYIKCLDIDTNKEIPDTAQEIPGVEYGKPKTVTYPPVTQYKVQGSYQTFSASAPDKSKMETATSQTVTLSSTNKNAYVYFWYKVDNTMPPVKPPEKINYDPIAIINNPAVAYAGDDVLIDGSRSYDTDGYVERWIWDVPGTYLSDPNNSWANELNNAEQDIEKGTVWYPQIGVYGIDLEVIDDGNCSGYDQSIIEIIEPKPEINVDVLADKMKENRKITLDTSKSKSATRYPIDWNLTTWSIQPINETGATGDYGVRLSNGTVYKNVNGKAHLYNNGTWTDTGLDFNSVLKGQKTVYFQARDSGQYKITVSMTNTYVFNSAVHYSNTVDRTITVVEDLAPVADFSGSESNIREFENPIDRTRQKYGVIPVICTSTSPDGDPIGKRIWSARYDSDNDLAQGSGAAAAFADETTIYPYTGTDPFTSGIRLVVDGEYDSTAEIWSYEVGKFTEALQVYEDIPDSETVKELLVQSDYKSSYVQGW